MSARIGAPSAAAAMGYPDPDEHDIVTCPYCIDAREQPGLDMGGCLRHLPEQPSDERSEG